LRVAISRGRTYPPTVKTPPRPFAALTLVAAAAVVVGLFAGGSAAGTRTARAIPPTQVLLAFDTTGSMSPSIAASKAAAESVISSVVAVSPGAEFAVVSFRDRYYPGGEYKLEQPMTSNATPVVAAVRRLQAVKTLDVTKDTDAEAYNLLFHQTYTDARIGWQRGARRIVIVVGDAEPHSAGADGIAGCSDTTRDWNGLDAAHELAKMQQSKITLVMIRQASTATTKLSCYASLAARAYAGGAAVDGGTSGFAGTVVSLVKGAYAPFQVTPQLSSGVAGKTDGITVRVANPNSYSLTIGGFVVTLPPNVAYRPGSATGSLGAPTADGQTLTWQLSEPLAAYSGATAHIVVNSVKAGSGSVAGHLTATAPDGTATPLQSAARLAFVARPRAVAITVDGRSGQTSVGGAISAPLGAKPARAGSGSLVLRLARNRSVTLRPVAATTRAVGAPTALQVKARVVSAGGLPGCRKGAAATVTITDSDALTAGGTTHDALALALPRACGGSQRLLDAAAAGSVSVTLAFH